MADGSHGRFGRGSTQATDGTDAEPSTHSRRATLTMLAAGAVGLVGGFAARASSTPTEIEDWIGLDGIRDDLDGDYELVASIDDSSAGYGSMVDSGDGWDPIDTFTGTLDGQGHVIEGLHIDRPAEAGVGLFGSNMAGSVCDLGLIDASITGDRLVGVVAGSNSGTVERVVTSGSISMTSLYGGGLVGENTGTIDDSCSLASVAGDDDGGGIAGANDGIIRRCLAVGSVSIADDGGGLVGFDSGGTLEESYWDIGTTGQDEAIGWYPSTPATVSGCGSVSDSEPCGAFQGISPLPEGDDTMASLDFDGVWDAVIEDVSLDVTPSADGYPILATVDHRAQLDAQGIDWSTPGGGTMTLIISDSTFENNSVGISIGDDD